MRVHVQNAPGHDDFTLTPRQWQEACARAGLDGFEVSFANDPQGFTDAAREAEAIVTTPGILAPLRPFVAPRLKLLFFLAAGLDKLLPLDWVPEGVAVLNNRGAHGAKVGEYVTMALLMLHTRMPALIAAQQEHAWRQVFSPSLRGRHLVVVGVGDMGSAAGRAGRTLGLRVTGLRARPAPHPDFDRTLGIDAIDTVLPEADFLVLACPLLPQTRNLLDRRRIGLLKAGAGVVNVGRGGLLDQEALCDALEAGRLGGAMIDVTEPEPLPPVHRLWRTRGAIVTPHVSADDPAAYNPLSLDAFLRDLKAWREGRAMANRVDLARGY